MTRFELMAEGCPKPFLLFVLAPPRTRKSKENKKIRFKVIRENKRAEFQTNN